MNKLNDKLKVFAGALILSGSIILLPACTSSVNNFTETGISESEYETIIGELSEETGYTFEEIKKIGNFSLDLFNDAKYTKEDIKEYYMKRIEKYENTDKFADLRQKEFPITVNNISEIEGTEKVFEPYTHILIKTLDVEYDDTQLEYIEGYKLIDISYDSAHISHDVIAFYVNEVEVVTSATGYNEETNQYFYQNFGMPINTDSEKTLSR